MRKNQLRQPRPSRRRVLALLVCLAAASMLPPEARAQAGLSGILLSRSYSGQFLIQSAPPSFGSPLVDVLENDTNFVRLDPTLLTVSCERIKQLLWHELQTTSPWSGKIFLKLYPVASGDDPVTIVSEQFRDGWHYRVTLPNLIQRARYVRAITQVVLLEIANRNAQLHSAEIPTWLAEGLSRQLMASDESEIILSPPRMADNRIRMTALLVNARKQNPLEQAHQELAARTPLSFQQLSWPSADQLTGEASELYRSSAQLFVHQLLGLPDGPACVRALLENLAQYYNWQFAFMRAFGESFQRPVDIEKWWSLQLVHFTGRELGDMWPQEESWQKLDELLRSAVQIRIGTNELPLHAEVSLQSIIRDWEPARQTPALERKLRELQMLRPRLARELAPLVEQYCQVIETYVQNVNHKGFVLPFRKHALLRRNANETLQLLDELDAQRARLKPPDKPNPPLQAGADKIQSP